MSYPIVNPVIVNLATPTGWYPKGAERLRRSVNLMAPLLSFVGFSDPAHIGAPSHQEIPYAFKPYAIEAVKKMGFDAALWLDAACWLQANPSKIFEKIRDDGHLFFHNCPTGQWTSDQCLDFFGVTRDEAMTIPMIHACFLGLNFNYSPSVELAEAFLNLARNKPGIFQGSWHNSNGEVSSDPRCTGHRHDQSVISLLIHRFNETRPGTFKIQHQGSHAAVRGNFEFSEHMLFEYYSGSPLPHAEVITQGM